MPGLSANRANATQRGTVAPPVAGTALPVVGSGAPPNAGIALPSGVVTAGNPLEELMMPSPSLGSGATIGAPATGAGNVAGARPDSRAIHAKITPPTSVMHEMIATKSIQFCSAV
ncbi:MAG: hypothetical protein DWH75_02700 [Planctomycetota bacterium]|nr:MAG: hypothetical protein DWH75_02700 [Planctomycetota bacterium]